MPWASFMKLFMALFAVEIRTHLFNGTPAREAFVGGFRGSGVSVVLCGGVRTWVVK